MSFTPPDTPSEGHTVRTGVPRRRRRPLSFPSYWQTDSRLSNSEAAPISIERAPPSGLPGGPAQFAPQQFIPIQFPSSQLSRLEIHASTDGENGGPVHASFPDRVEVMATLTFAPTAVPLLLSAPQTSDNSRVSVGLPSAQHRTKVPDPVPAGAPPRSKLATTWTPSSSGFASESAQAPGLGALISRNPAKEGQVRPHSNCLLISEFNGRIVHLSPALPPGQRFGLAPSTPSIRFGRWITVGQVAAFLREYRAELERSEASEEGTGYTVHSDEVPNTEDLDGIPPIKFDVRAITAAMVLGPEAREGLPRLPAPDKPAARYTPAVSCMTHIRPNSNDPPGILRFADSTPAGSRFMESTPPGSRFMETTPAGSRFITSTPAASKFRDSRFAELSYFGEPSFLAPSSSHFTQPSCLSPHRRRGGSSGMACLACNHRALGAEMMYIPGATPRLSQRITGLNKRRSAVFGGGASCVDHSGLLAVTGPGNGVGPGSAFDQDVDQAPFNQSGFKAIMDHYLKYHYYRVTAWRVDNKKDDEVPLGKFALRPESGDEDGYEFKGVVRTDETTPTDRQDDGEEILIEEKEARFDLYRSVSKKQSGIFREATRGPSGKGSECPSGMPNSPSSEFVIVDNDIPGDWWTQWPRPSRLQRIRSFLTGGDKSAQLPSRPKAPPKYADHHHAALPAGTYSSGRPEVRRALRHVRSILTRRPSLSSFYDKSAQNTPSSHRSHNWDASKSILTSAEKRRHLNKPFKDTFPRGKGPEDKRHRLRVGGHFGARVTALTAAFIVLHIRGENEACRAIFNSDPSIPGIIAADIRRASLGCIIGGYRTHSMLSELLEQIAAKGWYTLDAIRIEACRDLLVAYLARHDERLFFAPPPVGGYDVPTQLRQLFGFVPRTSDLQLYAVRDALVYGALMIFMKEKAAQVARENNMFKAALGTLGTVLTAIPGFALAPGAQVTAVSGITYGVKLVNTAADAMFSRRLRRIQAVLDKVIYLFNVQVLRAAEQGYIAVYPGPADAPLPRLNDEDIKRFLSTSATVLSMVLSGSGVALHPDPSTVTY